MILLNPSEIYTAIFLYDTNKSREHIYDREKRKDIYASGNLTGLN